MYEARSQGVRGVGLWGLQAGGGSQRLQTLSDIDLERQGLGITAWIRGIDAWTDFTG
jgi:hypothetical protein